MRAIVDPGYGPAEEDRFLQLDVQFHLALARATGNPTVETLMRALFRQLEIARDMAMHAPAVPEWTIDIHERTLAAVRSGDVAEVEVVMDEHLGQLERTWEQESHRQLIRPLPSFLLPTSGKVRCPISVRRVDHVAGTEIREGQTTPAASSTLPFKLSRPETTLR